MDDNLKDVEYFDYYGQQVHNSRVLKIKGMIAPSFIRPRLRGWGLSVVEALIRSINQYLKSTDLTFEVLDEFKIDVYKIKGLSNALLTPKGVETINKRVGIANAQKNYQNAISMDSEDDYTQKQISFAGIAEVMDGVKKQIAADLRMPMTKIFGMSASGFSSGEDDIENYNSMVESTIRSQAKYDIIKIIKIRAAQLYGIIPDDLEISFKPLRILSSTDEEAVKSQKFVRILQARQAGYITDLEFRNACNQDKLLPVQLNTTKGALSEIKDLPDELDKRTVSGGKI
jgi:phage-related protein (TIGR01555 family)